MYGTLTHDYPPSRDTCNKRTVVDNTVKKRGLSTKWYIQDECPTGEKGKVWTGMKRLIRLFIIMAGLSSAALCAEQDSCPSLDSIKIRECGNIPFSSAAMMGRRCRTAERLNRFYIYLKEKELPCFTITNDISRRYASLTDTVSYRIEEKEIQWTGSPRAPVSIILYVSMSCPYCKQVYARLYDSLNAGRGTDTLIRVGLKNLSASRFDRVLVATAKLGKQPLFLRTFANISERISNTLVRRIADEIQINVDTLFALADSPQIIAATNASRQEALSMGVRTSPTLFINNHLYTSYKDAPWVIDAARHEVEKKSRRNP